MHSNYQLRYPFQGGATQPPTQAPQTQPPTPAPPTQPPQPTTQPTGNCKDVYPQYCPDYKKQGMCSTHVNYMSQVCPKTCGFCGMCWTEMQYLLKDKIVMIFQVYCLEPMYIPINSS